MYSKITYIYTNTFFLVQIPRDLINVFMFIVNLHVVMEDNSAYSNFGLSTLFPLTLALYHLIQSHVQECF